MNLGSFGWKLNLGNKSGKNYDQNSSLLTEYESPPLSPKNNSISKSSAVLFNNDNEFEDIYEGEKNEAIRNKAFITSEKKRQSSQEGILLDFFSSPFTVSEEIQKIEVLSPSLVGNKQSTKEATKPPVFPNNDILDPFPAFDSNEQTDDFGDFYSYSCSEFENPIKPGKDNISPDLFSSSNVFVDSQRKEKFPEPSFQQFNRFDNNLNFSTNFKASISKVHLNDGNNSPSKKNWLVISKRAIREFSNARSIFTRLDQISTVKDRMILSEFSPLKNYISALFEINDVLNKMRAASKFKSPSLSIPQNDKLITQWSELINLFLKLSIPCPPFKDSYDSIKQNDLCGYCKICLLPFAQRAENQSHSICQELYDSSLDCSNNEGISPLKTNTAPGDFLI